MEPDKKVVEEFQELRDNEPDEDSITTSDHCTFYQYGKKAFEVQPYSDRRDDAFYLIAKGQTASQEEALYPDVESAIRAYMDHVQFWPNVFSISDHGNAHRIDLTKGAK